MRKPILVVYALPLLLAACSPAGSGNDTPPATGASASRTRIPATADTRHFENADYGVRLDYPASLQLQHGFGHSYLQNGSWKTYAGPDSRGTPLASLVLPGSNQVTAGELRIGASRDPQAVRTCTQPPDTMHGKVDTRNVNGIAFTHFQAGDAAMSHYLDTRSYRSVHEGACIAIDLMVIGTNPKVYDPPRKPPFSHEQAFARLHKLLQGVHFTGNRP